VEGFLRFIAGGFVVLVIFYAGLLAYFIAGASPEDIPVLRTITVITLVLAVIFAGILLFLGSGAIGVDSPDEEEAAAARGENYERESREAGRPASGEQPEAEREAVEATRRSDYEY
jgi:cytochrome bd-type quinol oxidase subunit 1